MRRATLDLLSCPHCQGTLRLQGDAPGVMAESGALVCSACSRTFPIEHGITRFVRPDELSGQNRRFARFYDIVSYVYAPFNTAFFAFLGGEEKNRRAVLDRLEPAGGRVLEISIGPGVNLPYLIGATGVDEVIGLDISLGQLRRCRSLCRRRGWAVDLFLGMAEQLPFRDATFDRVLHIGGINFFSDKAKAMTEMVRVARPGAKLVVADESEKGARGYEWTIPGFSFLFEGKRETVTAPANLVPAGCEDVRVESVWRGLGYCLEFRKPSLPNG
jgi:ubiquinone/menaquinone biosynthesis C-methylase UbiE